MVELATKISIFIKMGDTLTETVTLSAALLGATSQKGVKNAIILPATMKKLSVHHIPAVALYMYIFTQISNTGQNYL